MARTAQNANARSMSFRSHVNVDIRVDASNGRHNSAGHGLSRYLGVARESEGITRDARKLRGRSAERLREKRQQIVKDCNLVA